MPVSFLASLVIRRIGLASLDVIPRLNGLYTFIPPVIEEGEREPALLPVIGGVAAPAGRAPLRR